MNLFNLWSRIDRLIGDNEDNALNGCQGDLVQMPPPGAGPAVIETTQGGDLSWTYLKIPLLRMKRLGQLIQKPGDPAMEAPVTLVYAEGLGLITMVVSGVSGRDIERLMGFTRNGKTTGMVLSDAELSQPASIRSPDAARPGIRGKIPAMAKDEFDLRGRKLRQAAGWNIQVTP